MKVTAPKIVRPVGLSAEAVGSERTADILRSGHWAAGGRVRDGGGAGKGKVARGCEAGGVGMESGAGVAHLHPGSSSSCKGQGVGSAGSELCFCLVGRTVVSRDK